MAIKNRFIDQSNNTEYGHKNYIINGDFQVWQRGTSFGTVYGSQQYTADRFIAVRNSWTAGLTVSQVAWVNGGNALRVQRNASDTSTQVIMLAYCLETADVKKLQGKTVTLQFKTNRGSNFSPASNQGTIVIKYGTGVDTGNGCTTAADFGTAIITPNFTFSNTGAITSFTFVVPTNATQLYFRMSWTPVGTAGANDYVDFADFQLETGSIATAIEHRPYGIELALCQRYYEVHAGLYYAQPVTTPALSGGRIRMSVPFKVTKRVPPTVVVSDVVGNVGKITTVSTDASTHNVTPAATFVELGTVESFQFVSTQGPCIFTWTANSEL